MIEFDCPTCSRKIRVKPAMAGRTGKCPDCATKIVVPLMSPSGTKKSASAQLASGNITTSPLSSSDSFSQLPTLDQQLPQFKPTKVVQTNSDLALQKSRSGDEIDKSTKPLDDPLFAATISIASFAVIYATLLYIFLDSREIHESLRKSLGPTLLGLDSIIVFLIGIFIFTAPLCFALYHLSYLAIGVSRRGGHLGRGVRFFFFAFEHTEKEPKLRQSLWITIGGAIYFFVFTIGWAIVASVLGI